MLYHAAKLSGGPGSNARRPLVLAACACARLVLSYVEPHELRPLAAIETAEAWARGGENAPRLYQVMASAYAAYAAAADTTTAAYAAAAATTAAYTAAAATTAAYTAAAAANAADARTKILSQCADIVRGFYPEVPCPKSSSTLRPCA